MIDKKAEILRCGKELFCTKGFKDTNVSDITRLAGNATGTFYLYYPSKDALFMEIYIEENTKLKRKIMQTIDLEADPIRVIKEVTMLNFQGMMENPILKEWYNKEVFAKIEQNFRKENGLEHVDFLYDTFIEIVKGWQASGKIRNDIDAKVIMAIFAAIVNVETHKDEIGFQFFPDVVDYLADFTMRGLMDCSNNIQAIKTTEGGDELGR
jgi:AcrR family transcriptional regulator